MADRRRPSVLFICVKNGGKSQIAAALMRARAGEAIEVHSAGTAPGSGLNEEARVSVEEIGASMAGEFPKAIDPALLARVDRVVVLGSEATVAPVPDMVGTIVTWETDEPSQRGIGGMERMHLVRDDIAARVAALADELTAQPEPAPQTDPAAVDGASEVRNVVIVGSGPAGLTAAVYAARASLAPVVFEGAVTAGGALMNTTEVENFPGFPDGIQGPDLMFAMRAQAEKFGTELVTDDIISMDLSGPVKTLTDGEGRTWQARAVILAMGSAYRELGLPDEKRLSGHGVSWCATCDGFFFRDQDIAVVGGGDSAIEEATFLTRFARSVTVIHRRDTLRASKIMADRAHANPKITFAWNSTVTALHGDNKLTGITLTDTTTGDTRHLPVTGLFVAIGHDPRNDLVRDVIDLDPDGYVTCQGRTTATSIPGVFACGDLVDHTYRQAITAAGSGCAAALDTQHYLNNHP